MTRLGSLSLVDPGSLPNVWRGADLASEKCGLPTGHPVLDEALPGGGWPQGSMVEVLQKSPGQHVWQLLLPGLATAIQRCAGPVVLVGSPYQPFGPSLKAQGLASERLLCVQAEKSAARLWATEQALRCPEVAAVMAWLPEARSDELRRLHMAAQHQTQLLFVFRSWKSRHETSPATLRLLVDGLDKLELHILKRKGPPLSAPLELPAHCPKLAALLQARKARSQGASVTSPTKAVPGKSYVVLDRTRSIA